MKDKDNRRYDLRNFYFIPGPISWQQAGQWAGSGGIGFIDNLGVEAEGGIEGKRPVLLGP